MNSSTLPINAVHYVCALVRERAAIELEESKSYLIDARLAPLAKKHGYESTADYLKWLISRRQPAQEQKLVEAMTTNETSFFRDIHPFNALKNYLLPELRTARASQKTLNIWSAASATGQELYSIAMIIREYFPELAGWNIELVGTDLSDEVLSRARDGSYSQVEINRGLPINLLLKYFQRNGLNWQIRSEIREMVTFRKLNLIESWPFLPRMDIVFLRNVLIYFAPAAKKLILQKVRSIMAPKAALFLGAAETTMGLDTGFERVESDRNVFYRLK